ncbi:MAG: TIGR01777 family protein [Planctomycetes bacterium]|nr:TIGR01777 family protein [Planctomycetota bacterium]
MRLLVTGATGFIGRRLCAAAARQGYALRITSRDPSRAQDLFPGVEVSAWDPLSGPPPPALFEGVDTVIHLAGESIAKGRWTKKKKALIRDSRVQGTRHLVDALLALPRKPQALISASAIGYYEPRGDEVITENGAPARDFLGDVCRSWEEEAQRARTGDVRVVLMRTGIALGVGGGALKAMLPPFQMFVGGPIAGGTQWMSWIHGDDLAALYLMAASRPDLTGPLNATAPEPVTNRDFSNALGAALGRPSFMPTPYFMLRLMLGEVATMLVASHRVLPARAQAVGFSFGFPKLDAALGDLLAARTP